MLISEGESVAVTIQEFRLHPYKEVKKISIYMYVYIFHVCWGTYELISAIATHWRYWWIDNWNPEETPDYKELYWSSVFPNIACCIESIGNWMQLDAIWWQTSCTQGLYHAHFIHGSQTTRTHAQLHTIYLSHVLTAVHDHLFDFSR